MRARQITLCDKHPDSPRVMFETKDGMRYTPEQWQIVKLADRLEKKIDRLLAALGRNAT